MRVLTPPQYRTTQTPNATMTTFASPSQGSSGLSLWRVAMEAGAQGPLHVFDSEQIWTAVTGSASVELAAETFALTAGDTIVLPAGVSRRITADGEFTAIVAGHGTAEVSVVGAESGRGTPPWIS